MDDRQNRSLTDYLNSSFGKLRSARNNYNNLKKVKQTKQVINLVKNTLNVARGFPLLGGGAIGGVFIVAFILLSILGGGGGGMGSTNNNQNDNSVGGSDGSTYTTPDCDHIDQGLVSDFGIVLDYHGDVNISCAGKQKIYKIYANAYKSSSYAKYVKPSRHITFGLYPKDKGAVRCGSSAEEKGTSLIDFVGLSELLNDSYCSIKTDGLFIIHETGHIIGSRNARFNQQFPYREMINNDGGCFFSTSFCSQHVQVTKTYAVCWDGMNGSHETFAESSALYVYNSKIFNSASARSLSIRNFKSECPYMWNYYNTTLFGGTIF